MTSALSSYTVATEAHVATVTLTGPGKGNALGPDHWRETAAVFDALDQDEAIRAVVLRGQGANFTFGLDLMSMMPELGPLIAGDNPAREREALRQFILRLQHAYNRVAACRKPIIAAVHGWCIGGGLDLIAACDIRLASAEAQFSLRETRIAIVADLGSLQRLPRLIGEGNTRELAFTAKDITAARAREMGLVNSVLPTPEALFDAAAAMARDIAANPPLTVQGVKHILNHNDGRAVSDGLEYTAAWNSAFLQSNDLAEAVAAFTAKRPPKFTGS